MDKLAKWVKAYNLWTRKNIVEETKESNRNMIRIYILYFLYDSIYRFIAAHIKILLT